MLQSISWSEFIIAITIGIGIYYVAILLLYYTKDIAEYIRRRRQEAPNESGSEKLNEVPTLMGSVKDFTSTDEEFEVSEEDHDSHSTTEEDSDQVSWQSSSIVTNPIHRSFSQLLEEINTLAYIISKNSKEEISLLFETLLARYPQLARPHYQSSINQFIIEACQQYGEMTLTGEEINAWWQHALDTTNIHQ